MMILNNIKLFTILVTMTLANAAWATDYKNVPSDKIDIYKRAVIIAVNKSNFTCRADNGNQYQYALVGYVAHAQRVRLESNGAQPVLAFETRVEAGEKDPIGGHVLETTARYIVKITTTVDYKQIITYRVDIERLSEVNTGDLKNPTLQHQWRLELGATCTANSALANRTSIEDRGSMMPGTDVGN